MIYDSLPRQVLEIPKDYVFPEVRPKRDIQEPNFETLKLGQKLALEVLQKYILNDDKNNLLSMLLTGFAGTGKTYLTESFVEWLVHTMQMKVAITAPTNKAVRVLKDAVSYQHENLVYQTIHKLLGLKPVVNERTGKQEFKPDYKSDSEPDITSFDVLIIDESSMLDDELFEYTYSHVKNGHLKLIFIGDPCQIPPVGKENCIPFVPGKRLIHKIGIVQLDEIIRQAKGNPIIDYSFAIRQGEKSKYNLRNDWTNEVGGTLVIDRRDKKTIQEICDAYFANYIFQKRSDFMKVIAWRNVTVNNANEKIRSLIYKNQDLKYLMVGEKLIADSPIFEPVTGKILFNTNDEMEVLGMEVKRDVVYSKKEISIEATFYETKVFDTYNQREKVIEILHETDIGHVQGIAANLKERALKEVDPLKRKWLWKSYYEVIGRFANIKYNYAISAHKSQGSTFDNALVLEWDIMENKKMTEVNRILYVAVTRAKKNLFIVQ